MKNDFGNWITAIDVNFTSQLHIVHQLLPFRNQNSECQPCVLFFAGGGTNGVVLNYSAYTVSKIALLKMCELLDAEVNDTKFVIVGPGWVKTKIHNATLAAGSKAGDNYEKTIQKLQGDELTSMEEVLDCCDWLIKAPREIVSGRNFSVVFDMWGTSQLSERLKENVDMYKLRRNGNNLLVKEKH